MMKLTPEQDKKARREEAIALAMVALLGVLCVLWVAFMWPK